MIAKQMAAERAVELFVKDKMVVGLGSGSTSFLAIQKLAERIREGLSIKAVPSSSSTEELAIKLGIPIVPFSEVNKIDVTIDGADEVDKDNNLIKGGGGALLREKILAYNSQKFVVIVDESKLVNRLGNFPLPVEIVSFASELTIKNLKKLNCKPAIRLNDARPYVTDNGNIIVDCLFNEILDPADLNDQLRNIPGVVENGLFVKMTSSIIVGYQDGATRII